MLAGADGASDAVIVRRVAVAAAGGADTIELAVVIRRAAAAAAEAGRGRKRSRGDDGWGA